MAINGAKMRNREERTMPSQSVNENKSERLSLSRFLCWTMAGDNPKSEKILKKAIITVAMATRPKSSGTNKRAKIPEIIRVIIIPEYFDTAVYKIPVINSFLRLLISLFY